jgi:aryl-alcohol dehydrogenase-like predicted oxidoreductase
MKIVSRSVGMDVFEMLANQPSLKLLDRAYELGSTHWDTADVYGDSEDAIGKW